MSSLFANELFGDSDLLISAEQIAEKTAELAARKRNTAVYEIQTPHIPAYIRTFQRIRRELAENGITVFKFSYLYWDSRTQKTWIRTETDNKLRNLPTVGKFGAMFSPSTGRGDKNPSWVNVKLFDLAVKSMQHAFSNMLFGKSSVPTADRTLQLALESDASWYSA